MGNLCLKCKACFDFLKPKQQKEQPIHQLVNLSKNPDVTEAKINPHQISTKIELQGFVNQSIEYSSPRDQMTEESNTSMEHHTQKQSLNVKSPVQKSPMPLTPAGVEKQAMLSQEESKTQLEEPMTPVSSKVIDLQDANQDDLIEMGEQSYEQFIMELADNEGYEEFQNDIENCRLRMRPYQYKKNQVTKVRISMEFNSTLQKFMSWADSKDVIDEDIYDYNSRRISDQLSVGSIRLKKYTIITAKQFTYLKYVKQIDQNTVCILYKSVILDEDVQNGMERAQINLAGIEVQQINDKLKIQGFSDINFNIRLQYSLTKRAFKEKILKDCLTFTNTLKV